MMGWPHSIVAGLALW